MNKQHQLIIEKLKQFLEELSAMSIEPKQETVELYIKEVYTEVTSLSNESNPYFSRHTVLEYLYSLSDIACGFAEIFEDKFPNPLNALNFRNIELKIAKQYKSLGGNCFWRDVWEIYIDISRHYCALNIDSKSLSSAKTALKLLKKSESCVDPRNLSYVYKRIAFAYQDIAPDKSITYFKKAADTIIKYNIQNETYDNYLDIVTNRTNTSILMYEINQFEDSIEMLNKALENLDIIVKKYGENETVTYYYAFVYSVLAKAYFELNEYENCLDNVSSGLVYYEKLSENPSEKICDTADILYSTASLALRNQGKYMKALEFQYKILSVWETQEENFNRSCRISDIYVDMSIIYSKYLHEQGLAIESARLSMKEIRPYLSSDNFKSSKKALSTRRRCFLNLADTYRRSEMLQSSIKTYKEAIAVIKEEFEMESEKISLIYSYAYSLYYLASLNFKFGSNSEGCKCLSHAYKSISTIKKYGGYYELLFNTIHNALSTYDKRFDGKIIELDKAQ